MDAIQTWLSLVLDRLIVFLCLLAVKAMQLVKCLSRRSFEKAKAGTFDTLEWCTRVLVLVLLETRSRHKPRIIPGIEPAHYIECLVNLEPSIQYTSNCLGNLSVVAEAPLPVVAVRLQ